MNTLKEKGMVYRFLTGKKLRVMGLILLFTTIAFWNVSALESYSISTRIDLKLQSTTLKQALKEIEKKTEFTFFYNDDAIDINRKITLNVKDKSIDEILSDILVNCSYLIVKFSIDCVFNIEIVGKDKNYG